MALFIVYLSLRFETCHSLIIMRETFDPELLGT